MKRLAATFALICCLSFPALGGHRPVGDAHCVCGTAGCIEDYPGECSGELYASTQESGSSSDATAEVSILLVALLLWLRLKGQ